MKTRKAFFLVLFSGHQRTRRTGVTTGLQNKRPWAAGDQVKKRLKSYISQSEGGQRDHQHQAAGHELFGFAQPDREND
jgi:hypothetical protein